MAEVAPGPLSSAAVAPLPPSPLLKSRGAALWDKPKAAVKAATAVGVSFAQFKTAAGLRKSGITAEEFLLR